LASTFFAGINVGADTAAWQALDQTLSKIPVDISVGYNYYKFPSKANTVLSSKNVSDAVSAISSVQGITQVEAISTYAYYNLVEKLNFTTSTNLIGISEHSLVYNTSTLGENDTYVWADSPDVGKIRVGDIIPINITTNYYVIPIRTITSNLYIFQQGVEGNSAMLQTSSFVVNLKVVGFVHLSEQELSIASFNQFYPQNLLITSWEKTFAKLLDFVHDSMPDPYSNPFSTTILVFVDRSSLISPWDITGSASKVAAVTAQINEKVSPFGLSAQNNLGYPLDSFQATSFAMRATFIIASLPVFFVAWYVGSTVSDVSFNLRRREIGLLLTKGFSRRQLWWMFLFEASLIGLLGGLLGIVLSFTVTPWFAAAAGGQFIGALVLGPDTIILTVIFAVIITFLSVYRSARRASKMAAVDALREYVHVEDVKPYKRLWPWAALLLGSFKMIVFLLGINLQAIVRAPANVLAFLLLQIVVVVDFALSYVGPFLFFWGFTKIFISGSLKFQEIITRAARFLGDLGKLATKSVQRNPARAAAVAFLIAFIIGYSFQVVGTLASEQDFLVREARFAVGSDISFTLSSPANASQIVSAVSSNVSHIQSITAEYSFTGSAGLGGNGQGMYGQGMQFRAVNPKTWLSTAYYEDDMFSGNPVEKAFETMSSNDYTIILDSNQAKALNKKVGDVVAVTFGDPSAGALQTEELTVVGFFGIESAQTSGQYWSYVPEGLYNQTKENVVRSASVKILIRLQGGADGKAVADQVRGLDISGVSSVSSVTEQLAEQQSDLTITGTFNVLRLGVLFMVAAASIGTALVTLVSLRERKREASIMSVRGLSFKQLLVMLLTENLAVVTFAVLVGTVVGLIVVRGVVASNNAVNAAFYSFTPLSRHMVFPPDALLTLFISFILVFASTIIPVILMAKRYSSRLERTVREV